jgi:hypothetical protein
LKFVAGDAVRIFRGVFNLYLVWVAGIRQSVWFGVEFALDPGVITGKANDEKTT